MITWHEHVNKLKKRDSLDIDDKFWRIQNLYPILNKEGGLVPLKLNEHQQYLAECIAYNISKQDYSPISVLKARQVGISTLCCIWFLDDVFFYSGKQAVIQSYQHISKDAIFRIIKTAYTHIYPPFKAFVKADNRESVSASSIYIPSLDSRIESRISVRSQPVNMMLFSEYALMDWLNILASLGSVTPKCIKIYESTAKGRNHFFKFWGEQKEKDKTGTHCLFFPWFSHKEYVAIPPISGVKYLDEKEKILKKKYNLSSAQLQWRRNKRAEMSLNDDHNSFEQEYPSDDVECFHESGQQLFDIEVLNEMFNQTRQAKPLKRYWLTNQRGENKTLVKVFKEFSQEDVNEKVKKNFFSFYGGVDPAEGVGRDYSVCVVLTADYLQRFEVVMTLRGHTDPTNFSSHVESEMRRYGYESPEYDKGEIVYPYLNVERNNHGHAVLALLEPTYDNLYQDDDGRLGFAQTQISRKAIMHNLLNLLRHKKITLNDPVIAKELSTLHVNESNKKIEAYEGEHDDTVLALALAIQGYFIDYRNYSPSREFEEGDKSDREKKSGRDGPYGPDSEPIVEPVLIY